MKEETVELGCGQRVVHLEGAYFHIPNDQIPGAAGQYRVGYHPQDQFVSTVTQIAPEGKRVVLTFKTPDVINSAADHACLSEEERQRLRDVAKQWVNYGEYLRVDDRVHLLPYNREEFRHGVVKEVKPRGATGGRYYVVRIYANGDGWDVFSPVCGKNDIKATLEAIR